MCGCVCACFSSNLSVTKNNGLATAAATDNVSNVKSNNNDDDDAGGVQNKSMISTNVN